MSRGDVVLLATAVLGADEARIAAGLTRASGVELAHRCPDLPGLLATAEAGRADAVIVSADLAGLDHSHVSELLAQGVAVLGLFDTEEQQQRLLQWNVSAALPSTVAPDDLAAAAAEAVDLDRPVTGSDAVPRQATGEQVASDQQGPDGQVLAVWGTAGAPGRTSVAIGLAAELAAGGQGTLLVDGDTYAASVAQHLALLDEAPGLAVAARLADAGRLDVRSLAEAAPLVDHGLRVISGLPRPARWPEIREPAFAEVLRVSRRLCAYVVVDVASPLEEDEELSYDTLAPRRNAVTVSAVRTADRVLAVGSADPVGLQRLVRGLEELSGVTDAPVQVVVTRSRATAVGSSPRQKIAEALHRFAGIDDVCVIPDDRAAFDHALLSGRLVRECAPGSPAVAAMARLADDIRGERPTTRRSRRGWRMRRPA